MPKALTREDVIERLHTCPIDSYALIANVAKGIALGVGSLVLLQILAQLQTEWVRLIPWWASLSVVLLSYVKWTRGTILTNSRSNILDSLFPLSMGIVEFLLFAILGVQKDLNSSLWLNWGAVLGLHGLTGAALVSNRIRLTKLGEDFDAEIRALGEQYLSWLRADRLQAFAVGVFALSTWAFGRLWLTPTHDVWLQSSLAVVVGLGSCKPLSDARKEHDQIDSYVSKKKEVTSPAAA